MSVVYNVRNIAAEQKEKDRVFFTNFDFVINELRLPKEIFDNHVVINRKHFYGQYGENEKNVLFNMVAWLKPKRILEFSPSDGYTTCLIAGACGAEGELSRTTKIVETYEEFITHEIDPECIRYTKNHLHAAGFNRVQVVEGDVLQTLDIEKLKKVDFFFIDSDHEKSFVQKYVDKFFDFIRPGAWVAVHDIAFDPINGETEVIVDWLRKNNRKKYFYVRDLANYFGINDHLPNLINDSGAKEYSTTLWFKNE